ncbi:hypothetical protein [Bosea thiooxidans]
MFSATYQRGYEATERNILDQRRAAKAAGRLGGASMTISTAPRGPIGRPGTAAGVGEDGPNAEFEVLLPRQPGSEERGRWFDLCFRLIILALAALWLLMPPAGGGRDAADEKAVATPR